MDQARTYSSLVEAQCGCDPKKVSVASPLAWARGPGGDSSAASMTFSTSFKGMRVVFETSLDRSAISSQPSAISRADSRRLTADSSPMKNFPHHGFATSSTLKVDDHRLAEDLTSIGVAAEGTSGSGEKKTVSRYAKSAPTGPDAMNHCELHARSVRCILRRATQTAIHRPMLPCRRRQRHSQPKLQEPVPLHRVFQRVIRGATIKAHLLRKSSIASALLDQRPISNAVDATNATFFGKLETSPRLLTPGNARGRCRSSSAAPKEGETLQRPPDGGEAQARSGKTGPDVVADGLKKPVGLAGVKGRMRHRESPRRPRTILIESAWWDPVAALGCRSRHGIHTDASHRFVARSFRLRDPAALFQPTGWLELVLAAGGGGPCGTASRRRRQKRADQAAVALHVDGKLHRILGDRDHNGRDGGNTASVGLRRHDGAHRMALSSPSASLPPAPRRGTRNPAI